MKPIRPEKKPRPQVEPQTTSGFPSPAEDYEEPALDLHALVVQNQPATYFLRADTDHMQQAGIRRGDILVVDRSLSPAPLQPVIAVVEDNFVVKLWVQAEGSYFLADDSGREAATKMQVWGTVTYVVHKT